MDPVEIYGWLVGAAGEGGEDGFDAHVLASVLALAVVETEWGAAGSLGEAVGLDEAELLALAMACFPHAAFRISRTLAGAAVERAEDEACLVDLLWRCCADRSHLGWWLSKMVARRAQRPNHLWQDLGLRDRCELSVLMRRRFPALAERNRQDMKWKKFLYRTICRSSGYGLCTAPSCAECDDFDLCFGDETGESLMAQARRRVEAAAVA